MPILDLTTPSALTANAAERETWRPIPGCNGWYEVSDAGRVWSHKSGRLLKRTKYGPRYPAVILYRNGKRDPQPIHRLMLLAFVGPPPDGMIGLHWDDDPENNTLENLRWGTYGENRADAIRNGARSRPVAVVCVNGHDYTPENTYVSPKGVKQCRICKYERNRAWRAGKVAA